MGGVEKLVLKPVSILFPLRHVYLGWPGESSGYRNRKSGQSPLPGRLLGPRSPRLLPLDPHVPPAQSLLPHPTKEWGGDFRLCICQLD